METAIGVFPTRERAEEALRSLLEHQVPEESVVYLTRSENDAIFVGKQFGAGGAAGGATDGSAGIRATSLQTVPGVGSVFAMGPNVSGSVEDLALFRRVLNEGYSIVIVRTEFPEIATIGCEILDRLGLKTKKSSTSRSMVTTREVNGPMIAYVVGRIALGDGALLLRDTVQDFLRRGNEQIILDLEDVDFIDSAGLGELVRSHMSVRSHGGQLKLVNPSASVQDLLNITKLDRVFDIPADEATALASFKTVRRG
jgi:anti-sigma B factor antagonist